ncbi:MAG TPA: DNA polymerase III subunit psi, partial [Pantoea septica]|nr:DNA polymerase III subunit psi [Pantoea septica]
LVRDVLHVLDLQPAQVMALTPDQLQMLPESLDCAGWLIGIDGPHPFSGVALHSASLNELSSSGAAKRALWQQMCNHDSDLFPHP